MKTIHARKSMGRDIKVWRYAFRQLFAQAMTRWTILLLFSSFISLLYVLSFSFAMYLMSESAKFWMLDRTTRSAWKKKETNERANHHRFVYTVAIADEPTSAHIYIFFLSPTIESNSSSPNEEHCVFVHRFVRFVRFPSHSSQLHTNKSKNRTTRVFRSKDKGQRNGIEYQHSQHDNNS
jgi:hypothetical protein